MKVHILSRQDTLETLSARYGVPVCMIIRANGLGAKDKLFYSRKLRIPPADYCSLPPLPTQPEEKHPITHRNYVVQEMDTIFTIAQRFRTTMGMILEANQVTHPNQIRPGDEIVVPCLSEGFVVYSLQPTESLEAVADQFGVGKDTIMKLNHISGDVYPGMQLIIPVK